MRSAEFAEYVRGRQDDDDEHPLTVEETAELLSELLEHSPGQRLESEELHKAHSAVLDLFFGQCLLYMRGKNQIRFGWDATAQELILVKNPDDAPGGSWIESIRPR